MKQLSSFLENDSETAFSCPCQQGRSVSGLLILSSNYGAGGRTLMNIHLSRVPKESCWERGPFLSTSIALEWETLCAIITKFSPTCLGAYRHRIPVHLWVHFQGFLPGNQPSRTVNRRLSHVSGAWLPCLLLPNQSQSKGL